MASALYSVVLQSPAMGSVVKNVLAAPDSTGRTGLQVAIAAALAAVTGSTMQNAAKLGGKDIDLSIIADAPSPTERAVYLVQFQASSGPNGTSAQPLMIYANPAVNLSAYDVAIQTAAQSASATPQSATLVGMVDIDASPGVSAPISLTRSQFRALFTIEEQIAIDNYLTNPNLADDQKATITTILATFSQSEYITINEPLTIQSMDYLTASGLLTSDREAAILARSPVPSDAPTMGTITTTLIQTKTGAGKLT